MQKTNYSDLPPACRSPSYRQGTLCHRCSKANRNWGRPALQLGQEVQGGQ